MNKLKYLLVIFISGLIAYSFFLYLCYSHFYTLDASVLTSDSIVLVGFGALVAGILSPLISDRLNIVLPWEDFTKVRLLSTFSIHLLLYASISTILFLIQQQVILQYSLNEVITTYREEAIKLLILLCLVTIIFTVADFAIYSYRHFTSGKIKQTALQYEQLSLQYETLRSQLSPHFLFNSLNTISSLTDEAPEAAENFIRKLAHTYKYILNTKNKTLVTVAEELEFVDAYNYLLKIRFEDAFKVVVDLPEEYFYKLLPPLSLQLLVENAVKHNEINHYEPLKVLVVATGDNNIKIINRRNLKNQQSTSFNIGLENIRKRYQFFTNKAVRVTESDTFEVSLPLIQINQSIALV